MFAVVGEALVDMVQPEPAGPYVARPGGGPLNIAVGLRRLGHDTHLLARLSTGALGEIVRRHAHANDLDTTGCVDTADNTTLAVAGVDEQGRASYDFYVDGTADWGWAPDELVVPATARVVHTGSLATVIAPGAAAIAALFDRLQVEGRRLLSYDPNVRPALAGARAEAVATVESFVARSHVAKASDEDLGWLYPGQPLNDVLRHWLGLGPQLVVMTAGPDGCQALTRTGHFVTVPARQVEVVDTIGAGDAFSSGLLSGLADAGAANLATLPELDEERLTAVLRRAAEVAALTCERQGADPPTRAAYTAVAAATDPWLAPD